MTEQAGYENRVFAQSCETMEQIPDGVVQTCVTSPPYFGLRDYGVDGQIGLESTVDAYVARMVAVFREVRRTLRDDGLLWLNLGDSYAGSSMTCGTGSGTIRKDKTTPHTDTKELRFPGRRDDDGLKAKNLIGMPWRVAFALQADGWWLRSDIIWHKPNPMPSSVSDRCTSSHEYVFMLSKSDRYFFDADAIAEPSLNAGITYYHRGRKNKESSNVTQVGFTREGGVTIKETRNKRDVWTISTKPYIHAHFATFPPELPTICIRAGSREGDLVLDPFMGSGTVAEVAEGLGRRWVGYELNPAYHELIADRTRQKGLFTA